MHNTDTTITLTPVYSSLRASWVRHSASHFARGALLPPVSARAAPFLHLPPARAKLPLWRRLAARTRRRCRFFSGTATLTLGLLVIGVALLRALAVTIFVLIILLLLCLV